MTTELERIAETLPKRLGKAIRIRRIIVEKSQKQVAGQLDCSSTNYISMIETGHRCPGIGFLARMAEVLGVTVESLFADAAKLAEEASG